MKDKNIEPIKHVLVPKHEKLTKEKAEKFLNSKNIKFEDLPKIFASDAAIKHLNAKEGDIIKITRSSPTAKETVFYRGVING